jgi:hypothetical protein
MRGSAFAATLVACLCSAGIPARADAQSRGVYPLGMTATGSGITPEPGFTYANQLLFYSRDESKADDGLALPVSGQNAVIMDMNSFVWVSNRTVLGGARYSMVATVPVAKNQLVSDIHGQLSGGGGLADSYYLPVVLGWNGDRVSVRALAGFLAPTGRFSAGASDNVGSGYWTPTLSSGQTVHLTRSQSVTASAFELYEWHTTQEGTGTKPGGTINLDYSLVRSFAFAQGARRLQLGLAGYLQRQATAKTGPEITAEQSRERYAVNALGLVSNLVFPKPRVSVGIKYFDEFANRAAYQGHSFQVSGSVTF